MAHGDLYDLTKLHLHVVTDTLGHEPDANHVPQPIGRGALPRYTHEETAPRDRVLREMITDIIERPDKDESQRSRIRAIVNFIFQNERDEQSYFIVGDATPYMFLGRDRRVIPVSPNSGAFAAYVSGRYGLVRHEPMTAPVLQKLTDIAMSCGRDMRVGRFSCWDESRRVLAMSAYNGDMFVLDGNNMPQLCANGGLAKASPFFVDDDGGKPIVPIFGHHGILLDRLINDLAYARDSAMSPAQQKCLLTIWMFALAFPNYLHTKPLLLVDGEAGSGKSTAVKRIQLALFGSGFPLAIGKSQRDADDFGVLLCRSPLVLLDNVDEPVPWLRDAICVYTTGGGWRKRKLFTDAEQVELRPQAFVAVATKNPQTFRRDDIADRTLIIKLERRHGAFVPESKIAEEILRDRALLLGEYMWYLDRIVGRLRQNPPRAATAHRMADFAHLAHVIGDVIGYKPAHVEQALNALQTERDELTLDGDVVVDLIDKWLDDTSNHGRAIKIEKLHQELLALAKSQGTVAYGIPSSAALRQRLRNLDIALKRHVTIKIKGDGSYEFRRK